MTIKFEEMEPCVQESMLRVIEHKLINYEVTPHEAGNVVLVAFRSYQKLYEVQEPVINDGE